MTDRSNETTDAHDTVNRESHPNADSVDGLAGDMGLSSERRGPFEGIEGTGSLASAQETTDGETAMPSVPTGADPEQRPAEEGETGPDKPDDTARVSNVDRTVGEVQPDPVTSKHQFDPSKNPRH